MSIQKRLIWAFKDRYGEAPRFIARGPGRVNLIGEHTDYNEGFVMPLAINRAVWIALRPRHDMRVEVTSLDLDETGVFEIDELQHGPPDWLEYIRGVAWAMRKNNYPLSGWEGIMKGDVPIGAGLSSSAALEMAAARAFWAVNRFEWQAAEMARIGQLAENAWLGVQSGIMDQLISAGGKAGNALLIDCRSLEMEPLPLPDETVVVVLDTGTRRGLYETAYNDRREECKAAAAYFGQAVLRDITPQFFQARPHEMDPAIFRRGRHVVTENERVLAARAALKAGDAAALGQLMNASHASLRDDFEVSSFALDAMVTIALQQTGCYGARMTGAGFGGCAVALVRVNAAQAFSTSVASAYEKATDLTPNIYFCQSSDGASVVEGWT